VQIPLDEIVLLEPAQPFAISRARTAADAADPLQISLEARRFESRSPKVADDLLDDRVGSLGIRDRIRKPRARRCGRAVDLAREPEQLGETLRFEQLPVGSACSPSSASSARGPDPSAW